MMKYGMSKFYYKISVNKLTFPEPYIYDLCSANLDYLFANWGVLSRSMSDEIFY